MYSFMGIGAILEKLLSFKVIATLRYMKQTKKQKNKTKQRRKGKTKNI